VSDLFTVDLTGPAIDPPDGYVERELDFQVSMPSPLRRSMGDLITAIGTVAKTFDPNATNMELSKLLLGIALGEGLEVGDPGAAVERIFPEGYVDPAVAAALGGGAPGQDPSLAPGSFTPEQAPGPVGADGQRHPDPGNPYGAPMRAQPPEVTMQQAALQEAFADARVMTLHRRGGDAMPVNVQEAIVRRARERIAALNGQGGAGADRLARAVGQQHAAKAAVEADDVLGPALTQALATVAASTQ
jgi:hypothetical protein